LTKINIVTMPEDLALFETKRIIESLNKFNIKVNKIYLNKYLILIILLKLLKEKLLNRIE